MLAALYFPVPARTFSRTRSTHRPLKAQLAGELAVAADEAEKTSIRAEFDARERILEHEVLCRTFAFCVMPALMPPLRSFPRQLDHTPRELALSLSVAYNFLSK